MNIDIIFIAVVIASWFIFLIIYEINSVKKKRNKKIASALIQYINNYKNLLKILETENIDTSLLEEFDSLQELYEMITNYCCKTIKKDNNNLLDDIEKYEYIFNFKLLKNARIDIEFIELYNILLIDFIYNLSILKK